VGHSNAPLTPEGRRRLCERVDAGRAICHVAEEAGIARQTLGKWYERWISEGEQGLVDRSSRPECSPNQTAVHIEDRVEALRRERKLGPVQLMGLLAGEGVEIAASTVYRILVRRGISRLRDLDVSGEDLREPVVRYEWARPGDMVHVDVKKLGGSLRAAAIASTAAPRPSTEPRDEPRPVELGPATSSCTPPWTIIPA
jgi:transposase